MYRHSWNHAVDGRSAPGREFHRGPGRGANENRGRGHCHRPGPAPPSPPTTTSNGDEELLRSVGISTDGPGVLKHFRLRGWVK